MRLAGKFLRLDRTGRKLIFIAAALVVYFWFLLRILPFRMVLSTMDRLAVHNTGSLLENPEIVSRIAWSLSTASRRILGRDNCLAQAMAARVMFNRFGYPAEIKFGVKKDNAGVLQAHAWVFNGDQVLVGGEGLDLSSYAPLNFVHRTML